MEKEPKQGISKGVLLIIIILCLLLGLTSGYIVHDKLSNKEETKTEQKETENKKDNNITEEKEDKEETKEESNKEIVNHEKKSVSIDLTKECINSNNKCEKEYKLSNGEISITINTKIDNTKSQIVSINGKELYTHETTDIYGPFQINGIALLDNNIFVLDVSNPGYSGPDSVSRSYYNVNKDYSLVKNISSIYNSFPKDLTAREIEYSIAEEGCSRKPNKRAYDYYKISLQDDGSYNEEFIRTEYRICAGQS